MSYDVVIVGAGPIGLFLACELRLQGVRTIVLERRTEIDPTLKAGAVGGRGADILTRRGIVELLGDLPSMADLMGGRKPAAQSLQAKTAKAGPPTVGHFAGLWILRGGSTPAGMPIIAGQQALEVALEKYAIELGADVRRGHALTGIDQDDTGVSLTVEGPEAYELRAGWLVGCDGGRSAVRKLTGFAFPGVDGVITGHQALVEVDAPDFFPFGWHRTEHGLLARGPMPQRVLAAEFDGPPVDRSAPVTREELQASLRRLSGTEVTVTAVHSATRFTDNTRQAETYRVGRVLLAGDAAHVHPPFGGQGLTLGLGDAANLGWKLAAEVAGRAPDGLLDTYTTERHPAAARVLHNTRAQVALLAPGPRVDALRDVFTALASTEEANRLLTDLMGDLDLRYEVDCDHPLAGRYCPDLSLTVSGTATTVADLSRSGGPLLLDLDDRSSLRDTVRPWADRLEVVTARAEEVPAPVVLVRPDGYVAWAGEDADGLRRACARWFGSPR
ncbi:FAD-dependent monooxygenase [Actinoallomurus purpureus]|uniref:FAD-dependent monooxygenase n=1 Tax=Actinoallomurus purpureus TaxID=478114 RepID=UPI002092AE4C|nr:FAD-dependent monooxygenase [Actinoallomurus purpureus]MCO6007254.1 FAD-dependent monooxygenase [Actinoallomurus purpureus]